MNLFLSIFVGAVAGLVLAFPWAYEHDWRFFDADFSGIVHIVGTIMGGILGALVGLSDRKKVFAGVILGVSLLLTVVVNRLWGWSILLFGLFAAGYVLNRGYQKRQSIEAVRMSDEEVSILKALGHLKASFRTIGGVSDKTGISEAVVKEIIDKLQKLYLVRCIPRGGCWSLTSKGVDYLWELQGGR